MKIEVIGAAKIVDEGAVYLRLEAPHPDADVDDFIWYAPTPMGFMLLTHDEAAEMEGKYQAALRPEVH